MPEIIAVVEDLLFSSRIRNVAKRLGVEVVFAREADAVLEAARALPRLILFDLDAERLQPVDVVARLKRDTTTAAVPTLGFVSHVHADLIDAAREAGMDQVMARSRFVEALPDILAGTR